MTERIYIIDPEAAEPVGVEPISFHAIGVKERRDLGSWIVKNPRLLGEDVLVITDEFDKFDKSKRRLDVLALDREGVLVVAELKLDAAGSLADLQAIRYAAFCSTMTMASVVNELTRFADCTAEEASQTIMDFLGVEELPELGNQPRIILAAGSIDDQELTSTVLWLRRFGVDISCVELTPFRMPDSQRIVIAPRTIIPLPETKEYLVSVEKKESSIARDGKIRGDFNRIWQAVSEEFNSFGLAFRAPERCHRQYMLLRFRHPHVHYEWALRRSEQSLDVCLHFESPHVEENAEWLRLIQPHSGEIADGVTYDFSAQMWGRKWAQAMYRLPYNGTFPSPELAPVAAKVMKLLIERTWHLLEPHLGHQASFKTEV